MDRGVIALLVYWFCLPLPLQPETCKLAMQLKGTIMPISHPKPKAQARAITDEERKSSVFEVMRQARADKRLVGVREKRALKKAEDEKMKKK